MFQKTMRMAKQCCFQINYKFFTILPFLFTPVFFCVIQGLFPFFFLVGKLQNHRSLWFCLWKDLGFPGGSVGKEFSCNANSGSIHGWGRSPGKGNGYPLQYSCLKNPTDRGAWWATAHVVAKE